MHINIVLLNAHRTVAAFQRSVVRLSREDHFAGTDALAAAHRAHLRSPRAGPQPGAQLREGTSPVALIRDADIVPVFECIRVRLKLQRGSHHFTAHGSYYILYCK